MANARATDVVEMFNRLVRNPLNNGIAWGQGDYPPSYNGYGTSEYQALFTGSTAGVNSSPPAAAFNGTIHGDSLRNAIVNAASAYTAIRRVSVRMRYTSNSPVNTGGGWNPVFQNDYTRIGPTQYHTFASNTAIGHLNSGYRANLSAPQNPGAEGWTNVDYSSLEQHMRDVRGQVNAYRYSTVNLHRDYCHSSCHNNCHGSCHGDGPGGNGGGGDAT